MCNPRPTAAALLAILALAACGHGAGVTPGALPAPPLGAWRVLAIDGAAPSDPERVTLVIEAGGRLGGRAPCNSYGGRWSGEFGGFRVEPGITSTKMACPALGEEATFFSILGSVTRAEAGPDGTVRLVGQGGRSLTLARGPVAAP